MRALKRTYTLGGQISGLYKTQRLPTILPGSRPARRSWQTRSRLRFRISAAWGTSIRSGIEPASRDISGDRHDRFHPHNRPQETVCKPKRRELS